ncbi:hypothetical protein GGR55DRAFT_561196 [Xylaria sp. FL0064]|nr:hypothetical protein GGR55DRAFT_561196 [Xylaria sp. FL0064]
MIPPIKTVAILAVALLGRTDAGVVVKAPRTESPDLMSGHVFVEPVSTSTSTVTTIVPAISTITGTASTSEETPCTSMTHASNPEITAAPPLSLGFVGQEQKFVQTTYWGCATLGHEAHCGWHEPILDTSAANMIVGRENLAFRASNIAALVVGALMLVL